MADFNIKGQVEVDDKGSLKRVGKNAKDTADSFDRLGKGQNAYNKREKGVAGITANSTKAFSKMTTGIRGGLVPAYAVLAANIFALTAAFNALRRAAQVEDLARGLQFMGNVAGRDLKAAAERIRDVTGAAVSMGEAMRTTAVGISAGFRTDQLEQLAKVAKGASIALGRDMGDALDRLTRGVAKLEPEILDELGILVRLDEAADKYAAKLGTTADALTRFQRQQAFLNDTIEQGIKKYGDIADQLDPNAYDQLAAAAGNLSNSFLNLLNDTLKLGAVVEGLSKNNTALLASTSLLGAGIARQLAPGMFQAAQRSADAARTFRDQSIETAKGIKISGKYGTVMAGLATKIQKGEDSSAEFIKAQKLVGSQIKRNETIEKRYQKQLELGIGNQQKIQANLEKTQQRLVALRQGQQDLTQVEEARLVSTRQQLKANSLAQAQSGNLVGAFKSLNKSIALTNASTAASTARTGKLIKGLRLLRNGALRTAGAFKILGTSFLSFLPLIGLVVTGVSLLWDIFKQKPDEVTEALNQSIEALENLDKINAQFNASTAKGTERTVNAYVAYAGILDDVRTSMVNIIAANASQAAETGTTTKELLKQTEARVKELKQEGEEVQKTTGFWSVLGEIQPVITFSSIDAEATTQAVKNLTEEVDNLKDNLRGLYQKADLKTLEDLDKFLTQFETRLQLGKKAGPAGGVFGIISEQEIGSVTAFRDKLAELQDILAKGGDDIPDSYSQFFTTTEEGLKVLDQAAILEDFNANVQRTASTVRAVFQGVSESVIQFNSVLSKFTRKQKGEFDDIIGAAEGYQEGWKRINEEIRLAGDDTELVNNLKQIRDELRNSLDNLNIKDKFKGGETGAQLLENALKEIISNTNVYTKVLVAATAAQKKFKEATSFLKAKEEVSAQIQNQVKLVELELVRERIKGREALLDEEGLATSEEYLKLKALEQSLDASIVKEKELTLLKQEDSLNIQMQQLEVLKEAAKVAAKELEIATTIQNVRSGRGAGLSEGQTYALRLKNAQEELKIARINRNLQQISLLLEQQKTIVIFDRMLAELEFEKQKDGLQQHQLELINAQIRAFTEGRNTAVASLEEQLALQTQLNNLRLRGQEQAVEALLAGGPGSATGALGESRNSPLQQTFSAVEGGAAQLTGLFAKRTKIEAELSPDFVGPTEYTSEDLERVNAQIRRSFLETTNNAIVPMLDQLRELGPEGAVVAAMGEGVLQISDSMLTLTDSTTTVADKLAALGNIIASIASIQKASSDARVAAIEKEIEAEKKRDGKSAQSKAKIKQLEAKAEKEKRKAFETDKKMKMAQTVANTAAAIMGVISSTTGWDLPARIAMAAVVGAMGAAQLAIISGTSYQGGGSGAGGGLSSVSVGGDRANSVNLARATSPAGEMAYMRGQQGVGNMTNFRPGGFTGRKYRAFGGYTGFMVGEQGPEMFFPDRPGTVMPADDTAEMTGGSTNVNFTINTIDSQGVEDFIFANRGEMINAIREAANSHGQAFLEGVDVLQDRDRAGAGIAFAGVSKDRR